MSIIIGILAGLAWGGLFGFLNTRILARSIKSRSDSALLGGNLLRMLVDLIALGSVFLLREHLPFSADAALISTAVGLSLFSIVYAFLKSREQPAPKEAPAEEKDGQEE